MTLKQGLHIKNNQKETGILEYKEDIFPVSHQVAEFLVQKMTTTVGKITQTPPFHLGLNMNNSLSH